MRATGETGDVWAAAVAMMDHSLFRDIGGGNADIMIWEDEALQRALTEAIAHLSEATPLAG